MENQIQEQNQNKMTREHKLMFVPDGVCPHCGCKITKEYDIDKIDRVISGYPRCHRTFVD